MEIKTFEGINLKNLVTSLGMNLVYGELTSSELAISKCGQKATLVFSEFDEFSGFEDTYLERPVEADPDVLITHNNSSYHEEVIYSYVFRFAWTLAAMDNFSEIESWLNAEFKNPDSESFVEECYQLLRKNEKFKVVEILYNNDEHHFSFYDDAYFKAHRLLVDSGTIGELAVPLILKKDGSYQIVDSQLATHMFRFGEYCSRDRQHRVQLEQDYLDSVDIDCYEDGMITSRVGRLHMTEPSIVYEVSVDPVYLDTIGHASFFELEHAKSYLKSLQCLPKVSRAETKIHIPDHKSIAHINPLAAHFYTARLKWQQTEARVENNLMYFRNKLEELECKIPFHLRKRHFIEQAWFNVNTRLEAFSNGEVYLIGEAELELKNGVPVCVSLERTQHCIGYEEMETQLTTLAKQWSESLNRLN